MQFVHHDLGYQRAGTTIVVGLRGTEANVRLLTPSEFARYKAGDLHQGRGGHYKSSPASVAIPFNGPWHIAVDLGGFAGNVQSWIVNMIPLAA